MPQIFRGRYTSKPDKQFVVFIFGMRINNIFFFWLWLPVFFGLLKMVQHLKKYKDSGLLSYHFIFFPNGIGVMQYWESFDKLEKFAKDKTDWHVPNYIKFFKRTGKSSKVGIWHETYIIDTKDFETMYINMPKWGLAKATNYHFELTSFLENARDRIKIQ